VGCVVAWARAQDLYDVHMLDASVGWAVGSYDALLRTEDGGASWVRGNSGLGAVPGQIGIIIYDWYAVRYENSTHGWVVGKNAQVLHSADGGVSYAVQVGCSPHVRFERSKRASRRV